MADVAAMIEHGAGQVWLAAVLEKAGVAVKLEGADERLGVFLLVEAGRRHEVVELGASRADAPGDDIPLQTERPEEWTQYQPPLPSTVRQPML